MDLYYIISTMSNIITIQYFSELTVDEKANIVWNQGTFINQVIDYGKGQVNIYELQSFFVGVFYSLISNKIERIEVLNSNNEEIIKNISRN